MSVSGNYCYINKTGTSGNTYQYFVNVIGVNTATNTTSTQNLTIIIPPEYIFPTPADNSTFGGKNFTVRINDLTGTAFNITINNLTYAMTNFNGTQ